MRRIVFALCALGLAFAAKTPNPQLSGVHAVYLMPMGNSLDQYLATRLTETGLIQVVTDPLKADSVMTDKIGEGFERQMQDLYPPAAKPTTDEEKDKEKDPWGKAEKRFGSFSRGHGTIFLVDRASGNVIWSVYAPISGSRPDDVHRRAEHIADKLRKDLQGK
jgi:hypothetical protein